MSAAIHVRVSKPSKSRHEDTIAFDQKQDKRCESCSTSGAGSYAASTPTAPEERRRGGPGLDALIDDARRGAFIVVVVVWRFDRFARSVKQLVLALEEFRHAGKSRPWLSFQGNVIRDRVAARSGIRSALTAPRAASQWGGPAEFFDTNSGRPPL